MTDHVERQFRTTIGNAILGIDTLWGGDVMCASGTGRFIADSWFSDEPMPEAYTCAAAARVRESGGVAAKVPELAAIDEYLSALDVSGAIGALEQAGRAEPGSRGQYLAGLAECFRAMWDLALEQLGRGAPVPYARCVRASTGADPEPSQPESKRETLAGLLRDAGYCGAGAPNLLEGVDAWRRERRVPMASVRSLGAAFIAHFDELSRRNLAPFLPAELVHVPRANISFLPIREAWFSGSMNYLGRARTATGLPVYEATYEINASLEISVPEFAQLVGHEVVPGHVTTFAYLQNLWVRGLAGFEGTVLTMNTRAATLFEGIANNAVLMAHGVTEIGDLEDADLRLGLLLALLQDDAKNQASYLIWNEGMPGAEVARRLRAEFLVSEERAGKLSGAWGQHPLLGRMYLPAYRAGTDRVAALRRKYASREILPALYGCRGLVDITTVEATARS
jgi:hypothetical protein